MGIGGPHSPRSGAFPSKHGFPSRTAGHAARGQAHQAPGSAGRVRNRCRSSTSRYALHAVSLNGSPRGTICCRAALVASRCFRTVAKRNPCLLGRIPGQFEQGGEAPRSPGLSAPEVFQARSEATEPRPWHGAFSALIREGGEANLSTLSSTA